MFQKVPSVDFVEITLFGLILLGTEGSVSRLCDTESQRHHLRLQLSLLLPPWLMTNDTDSSAENQDKPPTTGALASPKPQLWLCSQAFLQERGMKLPHHAVKIWTATQQIKHPRIMVVWMFWSPWDIVYFCPYSFCPLSSTLLG